MVQNNFGNFVKHAGLPERAWQGHALFRNKIITGERLNIFA